MTIIAITATAILASFATAIGATSEETHLSEISGILKSYAEVATAEIQENSSPLYHSCLSSTSPLSYYKAELTSLPSVLTGYAVYMTSVTYYGTSFSTTCSSATAPQYVTIQACEVVSKTVLNVYKQRTHCGLPLVLCRRLLVRRTHRHRPHVGAHISPHVHRGSGNGVEYTVSTETGSPEPSLTATGLPTGVTFVDNGDGSGTLTGANTLAAGTYTITLTADNSVGSEATLTFELVVASPPVFTSASSVSFAEGSTGSFTVTATDTDSQYPSLAPDTTLTGALKNLKWKDNGNGNSTLSGTLVSNTTGT